MRHREVDRVDPERRRPFRQAAGEVHGRLGPPDDLDLPPREGAGHAEAERLADGLLAREAAGVALCGVWARVAVGALCLDEAALAEARVAPERPTDPLDLDQVRTDVNCHARCSSSHSGTCAIEETIPSGFTREVSTVSGRNFPVRTRTACIPTPRAPTTSVSRSSPTIHVIDGSASSARHAASKYAGLGLPSTFASVCAASSSPAKARARFMYEKTRFVSGDSSQPPIKTASALSPTRSTPSRSPTSACMTSARTRRPRSASTAASAVVCTSPTSRSMPDDLRPAARSAFERVVVFVTNRSRCPASRRRCTASAAPGKAWPETCRTPSTSSRIAAMAAESIRVTRSVVLPLAEVELQVSRSSGPGGQHAQKSETRVVAVFDVEASSALTETQKRRVVAKAGPVLRAVAQDERSQSRNRELAVERLVASLREALRVERKRVPTKPTAAARERRLDQKKRRSRTKRLRRELD